MKTRNLIFVFGAALMISFSVFSNAKEFKMASAAEDLGTFVFDGANSDSTDDRIYGINWTTNDAPEGWETTAFTPVDDESGTFIGENKVGSEIKKLGPNTYYIPVTGADEGTTVTVKGDWSNGAYSFKVEEISFKWDGSKWFIDLGTFTFEYANSDSTVGYLYGINNVANKAPGDWESEKFSPLNDQSGTFLGENRKGTEIKKINANTYYIPVADAAKGSVVTVKGQWGNSKYVFEVDEFTAECDGSKWFIDLGTITFDYANQDSAVGYIYGVSSATNKAPASWDTIKFSPLNDDSGTFVGENRKGTEIKKILSNTYYVPVAEAEVGTVATVKGQWGNAMFHFTVSPFTVKWNGSAWEPLLETYDLITLSDAGFDDKDRESFESNRMAPCAWNTYIKSSENTRNSFALRFEYESYEVSGEGLSIRVGSDGAWNHGHNYQLYLNNSWGGEGGGAIWFYERNGDDQIYTSGEIRKNLQPGTRHTIEFGSIYIVDSDKTMDYVKYDGETIFSKTNKPASDERSTKVGCSYSGNSIFFGSTPTSEKENTQIIKSNHLDDNKKGIYLDAGINDIPSGELVKGAPASKYNALLNGEPMYEHSTDAFPIIKRGDGEENSYYLTLVDTVDSDDYRGINISLQEGDVITLSGEFRFYYNGVTYSMTVIPVSFLYSKNQISDINIRNYLYQQIQNHCDPAYYDDDKLVTINGIIENAETPIKTATDMKSLWALYHNYIAQLDAVPLSEAKVQEILNNAKTQAKATLNAYLDPNNYQTKEYNDVKGYVEDAIAEIELAATDTVDKVNTILESAVALIEAVETKLQFIEKTLLASNTVLDQYLESYEVVTTTDLNAVGEIEFGDKTHSYASGGYDDMTTRIATSSNNTSGNMIFKFKYSSDDPTARCDDGHGNLFSAQIYIRMRGTDSNAYRFEIATAPEAENGNAGVGLCIFKNDKAVDRIICDNKLEANKSYDIEVGAIDLKGYNRTFLFIKIGNNIVLNQVVDSLANSRPAIAFRDSYVASPHYAKLSPIDDDNNTKTNYATLLGRLILDESASKEGKLILTLKDNNIPNDAKLYPLIEDAFKLNGDENNVGMNGVHPAGYIQKSGQNKYVAVISGYTFKDNDRLDIGGYFSVFSSQSATKSVYRLFDTTLIYHAASDSWEQITPTDPETIKYEAKETIGNLDDNLTNYSEANANEIRRLVEQYLAKVEETDVKDIPALIDEVSAKIAAVKTLLDEYKDAAKAILNNYRSADLYRADEQAELAQILRDAIAAIDKCNDNTAIDKVVRDAKASIDALKTASQRDAEELADAKKQAKNEIDAYFQKIEMNRYNDAEVEQLTNMTYDAYDDVDNATSIEEINSVVDSYKEAVKAVQTKDGSTFDGEKYIEAPAPKRACGGTIEAFGFLSFAALLGAGALIIIKKLKEN